MQKCKVCGNSDFYKESGYFFCQTCQTQNEDIREEIFEVRVDSTTRLRKTRIRTLRSDKTGEELGWTSWELYNFVLIGITNELIELGVPSDIKLTILQLWATYLGKLEVAFTSRNTKAVPKLARRYNRKDAEIIYGKVQLQKRIRKRKRTSTNASTISGFQSEGGSSGVRELNKSKKLLAAADYDRYLQSQASSEGDGLSLYSQSAYSMQSSSIKSSGNEGRVQFSYHAKEEANKVKKLAKNVARNKRAKYKAKHISSQYRGGPYIITPMRLWAIVYLALRLHNQPIQLGDMLRYGREGHLSYYKLDHLLPPDVALTKSEANFLSQTSEITHKGMRRIIASMAKFLKVWHIVSPDFSALVSRYCQELGLPRGIQLYTERLIALSPPKMTFDSKKPFIPNYEGRAIAFIIVVLKTLIALDDITEYQISRIAEKINRVEKVECKCYENTIPRIIVHGGAGSFSDSIDVEKMTGCKKAAINGYKDLLNGKSSVEAVETALWWLECDEFFNCSYGSSLNKIGKVQMDASIMDGLTSKCGSVAAVSDIEHPITLAKYVMNNFPNSIFVGEGAKNLAKHANLNWISEGNMVAPMARVAFELTDNNKYEAEFDNESLVNIDMFSNSFGTVGCVAYDGFSIAAGTTTGGLKNKLEGRVGDSPLLGCGTFATKNIGCSLTGHGESIMKLGLSRAIVEAIEHDFTEDEALHKFFTDMLNKYEQTGGGIVLNSDGQWAKYFTTDKMPYAVIENDIIRYGTKLHEEKSEIYGSCNAKACGCKCVFIVAVAIEKGLLSEKLFSFQEWQQYIECRKTILTHSHYPTKMKYSPDTHGIDDLYIKFLEFVISKADRKQLDTKSSKHFVPEELVDAMTKYIVNLSVNDLPAKAIDIFPASLTPLYSYLQQLLDHPLYDIPSIARNDFFLTKVGYMTKPDSLIELATRCGIELEVINSSLHFLEKVVLPFEQPKMPTVEELKQLVDIQDDLKGQSVERSEHFNDYIHRKMPCEMKLNRFKEQYYDSIRNSANCESTELGNVFTFTEILPNGRLAIPTDNDSETEEKDTDCNDSVNKENRLLDNKFCNKYNLCLSLPEKESISKSNLIKQLYSKKRKLQCTSNDKGQFIKKKPLSVKIEKNNYDTFSETKDLSFYTSSQENLLEETNIAQKFTEESFLNNVIDVNIDINKTDIETEFSDLENFINSSGISLFGEDKRISMTDKSKKITTDGKYTFFRPFKEYWMYHCNFSRVKSKNFALFEKTLPRSFRWLLNECALMGEMSTEDLYEEVCLIEAFHAYIFKSSDTNNDNGKSIPTNQMNLILNKW